MRAPLGLKRTVEVGKVKQSFSHGRSNTVIVETKKARTLRRPGEAAPEAPEIAQPVPAPAPAPVARAPEPAPKPAARPVDSATARKELQEKLLREAEGARLSALEKARRREDKQALAATEDEKRRAEENRRAEEDRAEEARRQAEEEAKRAAQPQPAAAPPAAPSVPVADEDEEGRSARARHGHALPKRPEP